MSRFRVERVVPVAPEEAWRRLTRWPAHARRVPLTRTRMLTPGPNGVGTRFTARTGIGRLRFDDPMEVVRWEPPAVGGSGVCRLEKSGRSVRGWAVIEVSAAPGGGSRVVWTEELSVRGLPRAFDPVLGRAGRWLFGRVVDGLLGSG
ncbi:MULTISPECIES: SRPBCC family protein [unclassified Streptomyces]|uniref:SRPBCC family protein n=1 Tax=unclassified Streptomyces TaxID=2593676 RepID=UPI0016602904|nr:MULTISPECIES: SRPBCC family protein [unclassified Streptomyces]MBD0710376.1 Immediate-early protein 2 [Streptomyces sp. CBMA291]MBD0712711.1 Immediate-early protein 2 [Streptomyces sp. CBMA370]